MSGDSRPPGGPAVPRAVRDLLGGIVDYAGLFPPAGLEMREAVASYASYRQGADRWALGRFVVPAGRLDELAAAVDSAPGGSSGRPWRLSALVGPDLPASMECIRAFNQRDPGDLGEPPLVDVVELKAGTLELIPSRTREILSTCTTYVEIPTGGELQDLVAGVREAGARAKVRTGGVAAEMIPDPDDLLRFLRACVEADLPFKATAGLHHPVAGRYPLTYERDSSTAPMYGYLNLLFATALLRRGEAENRVAAALAETDAGAFHLGDEIVAWREHRFSGHEIAELRERGMVAFGSCSFREPMDELRTVAGRKRGQAPNSVTDP